MTATAPKNPGFKNYAFISYSRKDEREASWLHKALERFRIPSRLPPLPDGAKRPKHLRPVFRDKKDLEYRPDSFVRQIEAELPASRFLIVMCSPNAAQSHPDGRHYVDWEIRQFIQAHGTDYARSHILPVVLAGKPGCGDPEQECLPPALLEFGPSFLEHNFPLLKDLPEDRREQKEAREDCVIGCVAFLLGVDRKVIRDRYLQAQRERLRLYVLLATGVGLLLAGLAVWAVLERGRADREAQAAIEQRDRADKAKTETEQTLARADFEEASRRLDDPHDTSRALAYLGSSLSRQPYAPAESRLQDLILHRSWLVEREAFSLKDLGPDSFDLSPALDRVVRWRAGESGALARISLQPIGSGLGGKTVELDEPAEQAVFPDTAECVVTQAPADGGRLRCRFWRASDGAAVGNLLLEPGQTPVGVSPKGGFALVGDDRARTLSLVRTSDGQRLADLPAEDGWRWQADMSEPRLMVFARDESAVFVGDRQGDTETFVRGKKTAAPRVRIRGYATADGRELWRLEELGDIAHLVCAPDGAYVIYSYSANGLENWQLVQHALAPGIEDWSQTVGQMPGSLLLSPDGCSLAVIDGKKVAIRDPYVSGAVRFEPKVLPRGVYDAAFSHDGRRLGYITTAPTIGVFDVETGKAVVEPCRFGERVSTLAFSRDDRSLRVEADSGIRQFDMQVSQLAPRLIQPGSQMVLQQVAADPAGKGLALVSSDGVKQGAVELRTSDGGVCALAISIGEPVNAVAFSPDGKLLAVGTGALHGGALRLYPVSEDSWKPKAGREESLKTAVLSRDGSVIPSRQKAHADAVPAGQRIAVADGMVRDLCFSADGRLVVLDLSRGDEMSGGIALIDVATCALVPNFIEQHAGVAAMALSADGRRLIVAGGDRVIRIWDLLGRRQVGSEARMNVPVGSVDVSADGKRIAVGMRFGDSGGQLQLLSGEGLALWEKPRSFMSGVQQVRFAQDGNSVATAFRDNSVAVFDSATGKPRTDEMEQALAIAELRFLDSELSGSIIGVGCGGPNAHGGTATAWVLLDKGTGRKLSDPVTHSGNVRGLAALPGDRFASWSTSGCIVAAVPRALGQQGWNPGLFSAITTALGGWRLNEWRAPEAVVGDPAQALALAHGVPGWEALLAWWAAPTAQRTVEPGGTVKLATRLDELVTKGYLAEYRQVLDLQPDHAEAMAEYWFTVARETATDALLKGDTIEERKQRQMEWAQLSNEARRERIFANPKAKRLADFWTAELCAKHPELARAWQERATFLRLVGREAEASDALAKALSLGGGDFASREQLALLKAQQGDFAGAAEQFDTLCDWLEKNPPTGDGALRTIAKAGQNRLHFGTVGRGMDNVGRDVRWTVDNLAKALAPISRLSREQGEQLIDASEKLIDLLARFDAGPALAVEADTRLLAALEGKSGTTNFETLQATLLGHRALAEILCGEAAAARRDLDEAQRLAPDLAEALEAWRAHSYAIEGRAEEAQSRYAPLLELDAEMAGALSKELALDFQRLKRRGRALVGLEDFQRRLFARVAAQPNGQLVVFAILPGGQAEKAGIKVGDWLVSYAGEPVLDWDWFAWDRQIESREGRTDPRTVVVSRAGRQLSFQVPAGRLGLGAKGP